MPIEVLGRTLAFGKVKSGEKAIAPSIEGEGVDGSDGDRNRDDVDGDGTASGSNADSMRVNSVWLAGEAGHPSDIQPACTETLGIDSDADISKPYLKTSIEWKQAETLT
ncbi:hypothetical protein SCLCIDRAFT_25959 [Scleroderma citrinum Foug A]|uniref:Uncharacterized protein n=1 Tax=Scleroderma citrinum Foug A TaxID=1036808 RepID=A0A0C2ZI75_9AGAM|nr:hypothetical protein SCLCIDRAFT_25959 [Scleroderma citrinum Foug A]